MTVARLIYFGLPDQKFWGIKAIRTTALFVCLDVVCFIVQGTGGSLLSSQGDAQLLKIGKNVYIAGMGAQLAFIILFAVMTIWFYRTLRKTSVGPLGAKGYLIWTMLAVMALIVVSIESHGCGLLGIPGDLANWLTLR